VGGDTVVVDWDGADYTFAAAPVETKEPTPAMAS